MAATSDEEMEKLLTLADQISDDFIAGIHQFQTLNSKFNAEISNNQSLQLTCSNLKQDNDRLKNLNLETLNNLLLHLKNRGNSQSIKSELSKITEESRKKDESHKIEVDNLKRSYEERNREFEVKMTEVMNQKAVDAAVIYQLRSELVSVRNKVKEVEVKYKEEVEDLRDCAFVEQQEKEELIRKVRELEKEVLITRTKMNDQQVSTSDKQLEVMKQKMMKLRRENEVLKRKLNDSKEN